MLTWAIGQLWSLWSTHVRLVRFLQWKWTKVKESCWISLLMDLVAGIIVCAIFEPDDDMAQSISNEFDNFIAWLQSVIQWLMGNPAGLKLNKQLNTAVGNFFLYHIYLWKTYITFLKPFLLYSLVAIKWVGCVGGVSLQVAVALDLISILTVHIYCFYVYAGRLYQLQKSGLVSLWRLFRVFTVLVFLLPTILVYYAVFAGLQLVIYLGQTFCEFTMAMTFNGGFLIASDGRTESCNFSLFFLNIFCSLINGHLVL